MVIKNTEEDDKYEKQEYPRACTKSELVLRYLSHVTPAAHRHILKDWIERNGRLKEALSRNGYTENTKLLSPAQIQQHYYYLGGTVKI